MSNSLMMRLAAAISPGAFSAQSERPDDLSEAETKAIADAIAASRTIIPILNALGIDAEKAEALSLQDDMEAAHELIEHAVSLLERKKADARSDLDDCIRTIEEAAEQLQEQIDDICCDNCGEFNNDGEGYGGLCGSCADREEEDEDEESFHRDNSEWPSVGDRVAMDIDESVYIRIAAVCESQPNLSAHVWEIVDENDDHHLIEDDGSRWETVNPMMQTDLVAPGEEADFNFTAFSLDEGVNDGEGTPERIWRGQFVRAGEPVRSTDLLYATPQEACLAAVELQDEDSPLA